MAVPSQNCVLQETHQRLGCWLACCFCIFMPASYHRENVLAQVSVAENNTGNLDLVIYGCFLLLSLKYIFLKQELQQFLL
jgi:hypothetical protein